MKIIALIIISILFELWAAIMAFAGPPPLPGAPDFVMRSGIYPNAIETNSTSLPDAIVQQIISNIAKPNPIGWTNGVLIYPTGGKSSSILILSDVIYFYEPEYRTNWETITQDPTNALLLHQVGAVLVITNAVFTENGTVFRKEISTNWIELDCLPQRTILVGTTHIVPHGKGWSKRTDRQ